MFVLGAGGSDPLPTQYESFVPSRWRSGRAGAGVVRSAPFRDHLASLLISSIFGGGLCSIWLMWPLLLVWRPRFGAPHEPLCVRSYFSGVASRFGAIRLWFTSGWFRV